MITFRKATVMDIDRISEIYDAIHTKIESGEFSIGWVREIYPTRETCAASIEIGDMFVEVDDGTVVAAGKINQEQVPEYKDASWTYKVPDELICVLHTLVVDPERQEQGYGKKFVKFYETYAREQGTPYLRMDTNVINSRARAMYHKLGYDEVGIVDCTFNGIAGVKLVCLEKKA